MDLRKRSAPRPTTKQKALHVASSLFQLHSPSSVARTPRSKLALRGAKMAATNSKFMFSRYTGSRETRAKAARSLINDTIPSILRSHPRSLRGVEATERIVCPPRVPCDAPDPDPEQEQAPPGPSLTIVVGDVIQAAAKLHAHNLKLPPHKRPRIAVLNMASPLRPGGGFLTGAGAQEESICRRTTLYPSLREEFYRLPEVGGLYTADALVFKLDDGTDPMKLDSKKEWFSVDVVTASMLRHPDVEGEGDERRYTSDADREAVLERMRAVMRMLKSKDVGQVVLGAWGCGAHGNPVGEVATAWRRVLLGKVDKEGVRKNRDSGKKGLPDESECWRGMDVVFAIKDDKMAMAFGRAFGPKLLEYGISYPYEGDEAWS